MEKSPRPGLACLAATLFLLFFSTATQAQWSGTGDIYYTGGNVGVGLSSPETRFHVANGNYGIKSDYGTLLIEANDAYLDILSSSADSWGSGINLIEGSGSNNTDMWSIFRQTTNGAGDSRLSFRFGSNTNPTANTPFMSLFPDDRLQLQEDMALSYGKKYRIDRYNVTSEMFITGHGQGGGWMINASYSGSSNPQTNATFDFDGGTYNTGAGYLDFDGNARMWSLNITEGSSIQGSVANFVPLAAFRYNQYVSLSPNADEEDFYIESGGNIGIGTSSPTAKLEVDGNIISEEIKVQDVTGADFVFEEDYPLRSLEEIKKYILEHKHLPDVAPASEMEENGINLGEMNMLLLRKIEELTLHVLSLQSQINQLKQEL